MGPEGSLRVMAIVAGLVCVAGPVSSQAPANGSTAQVELVQAAAEREAAGELAEAERLLLRVLEDSPASVPALLALERVLRIQGRLETLPPRVERAVSEDPESSLLNRLLVRTYSELDQVDRLEAAAESWTGRGPTLEIAHREVAAVWEARGEYGRARDVLEEGRRRSGRPDALALELGDLYAAVGEPASAVREWARSIDPDGRGLSPVQRRLQSLPDGGAGVVSELVDILARDGAPGRVDAALDLAVGAGLGDRAGTIAEGRLAELEPEERRRRLDRLARHADAAGLAGLAHWAYDGLLGLEPAGGAETGRRAALRQRRAELALELGDTSAAARGLATVEAGAGAESAAHRRAAATRIELLAAGDPVKAAEALARLRESDPESGELDGLTAAVARGLLDAGRDVAAAEVLEGTAGPASSLVRARMLLAGGDVAGARTAYLAAAAGLRGAEATAVLTRVRLLARVSQGAARVVGDAVVLAEAGRPGAAVDRVMGAVDGLSRGDAPALLEFGAALAEAADLPDDAAELRRRLVESHPRSPEAPGALLALARSLESEESTRSEARELLERLIIEYPRSALVPEARQALARLVRDGVA